MKRIALVLLAACLGCDRTNDLPRGHSEAGSVSSGTTQLFSAASVAATAPAASVTRDGTTMPIDGTSSHSTTLPSAGVPSAAPERGRTSDAGALGCHVVRGPAPLPRRGPANLSVRGDTIEILQNDDGRPRLTTLEAGPFAAFSFSEGPSLREADGTSAGGGVVNVTDGAAAPGSAVACARAGDAAFCPDRSGTVRRVALRDGRDGTSPAMPERGRNDDRTSPRLDAVVASSRSGSRVAAGALGTHAALAYLASRTTSEGWLSEAWLAVDDDAPIRLSEEGSGATSLALARYGDGLLALMVDSRAALTALHARVIERDTRTRLGEDVVVFVGGPGDRRSGAEVVFPAGGPGWGLLPIARDMGTFGLAVVRLDQPPRVDEPVVWSMYPNGLDPAGLAAVAGEGLTWLARVVPRGPEPSASRVLELGQVDSQGAFLTKGTVRTADNPRDVALAIDSQHAIWVAWVDRKGAWIERVLCR